MKRTLISLLTLAFAVISANAADYNIKKFGAVSDTTKLSTKALQRAIDACSAAGGGRVVVPTGNYKIGTIILKDNVHLHLERGATLYGSTSLADYIPLRTDFVSLRTHGTTVQLIYADKAHNVVIDGYGTIDGRGRNFPVIRGRDEGITRPHLLRFVQSQDIVVKDVTLRNAACWMQHYLACDRIRIDGVKVYNRNNFNNDALDLDGCHDVVVTNFMSDSDDDGITLKSTSPRLCENIAISNCLISTHCNAVKMGTETTGGFRNITIDNIVVKPSKDQKEKFCGRWLGISALALEIVDGGVLENVNISNFTVEGTEAPIFVRLGNRARKYKADAPTPEVGSVRGIHISNICVREAGESGCSIQGIPGHYIENVVLDNISIHHRGGVTAEMLPEIEEKVEDERIDKYPEGIRWGKLPAKGFFVRHARNIKFNNLEIKTEQSDVRPDIVERDTFDVTIK